MYAELLYYSFVLTSSGLLAWRCCQSAGEGREESRAARERRHEKERSLKSQARAPPFSLCPDFAGCSSPTTLVGTLGMPSLCVGLYFAGLLMLTIQSCTIYGTGVKAARKP